MKKQQPTGTCGHVSQQPTETGCVPTETRACPQVRSGGKSGTAALSGAADRFPRSLVPHVNRKAIGICENCADTGWVEIEDPIIGDYIQTRCPHTWDPEWDYEL